ncbi:Uncharacterized protein APZ42_008920 [Daphnia magna]|uniref:Uncharacterized protein n=1 Tax=Daphnia magna TaxID=35525 RepID=A0A164EBM9_9CRUS|nr:Uncharacterized protein APZ42_008920 [Daphnia magna]
MANQGRSLGANGTKTGIMCRFQMAALGAVAIFWSNESSDSDLEDLQYFIQERIPRPKVNNYLSVVDQYTDEEFQRNFRMSRPTCESLIQDFADLSLYPKNNNPWLNASSICPGTHSLILMVLIACKKIIKFPSTPDEIAASKDQWEHVCRLYYFIYPDSLGLREQLMGLDSDIDIRTPAGRLPSACINRKLHTSITLQAICSYDKAFTDVFTGVSSKMHDANVYIE